MSDHNKKRRVRKIQPEDELRQTLLSLTREEWRSMVKTMLLFPRGKQKVKAMLDSLGLPRDYVA